LKSRCLGGVRGPRLPPSSRATLLLDGHGELPGPSWLVEKGLRLWKDLGRRPDGKRENSQRFNPQDGFTECDQREEGRSRGERRREEHGCFLHSGTAKGLHGEDRSACSSREWEGESP
jgi:hypothetical protein